ncbi:MAG: winged helix-turn-helix domain-containing protein [Candidatus Bathyarchaeota archaeon]|nr:MAG: winged helix-turn-helix domain-containing protein [Candidatus Bathyarchaeota archaeon]
MTEDEDNLQELVDFILSVDRRYLVLKEFQEHKILQASHIAKKVGRSLQNCSRALKELEKNEVVILLNPGKESWKRYVLSEKGKKVLNAMNRQGWFRE